MVQAYRTTGLFEKLRSFTTMAGCLDLSEAAATLGLSDKTLRDHIDDLETAKGVKLFDVDGGFYRLTVAGAQSAKEAETILNKTESWMHGRHGHADYVSGLAHDEYEDASGANYYSQQHPLDRLWIDSPPLLQKGFLAWSQSRFRMDDPAMEELKPYTMVYRRTRKHWVCVSVGEKSSLATWWHADRSHLGSIMEEVIGDSGQTRILTSTYSEVLVSNSARLDHVFAQIPREKGAIPDPVSYQRLLCACRFPDGEPALMVLIARTNHIQIASIDSSEVPLMPKSLLMEFEV